MTVVAVELFQGPLESGVVMVLVSVIFVSQRRRFWEPLPLADPSS